MRKRQQGIQQQQQHQAGTSSPELQRGRQKQPQLQRKYQQQQQQRNLLVGLTGTLANRTGWLQFTDKNQQILDI